MGGSSETDVNEFTVIPWRISPARLVTTATPEAQCRIACRANSESSMFAVLILIYSWLYHE
jgi:hypothetical protein